MYRSSPGWPPLQLLSALAKLYTLYLPLCKWRHQSNGTYAMQARTQFQFVTQKYFCEAVCRLARTHRNREAEGQLCPCAGVIDDCVRRGWTQNFSLCRIMTDRQSVDNIKLPVPFLKCCHASAVKLAASADCPNHGRRMVSKVGVAKT